MVLGGAEKNTGNSVRTALLEWGGGGGSSNPGAPAYENSTNHNTVTVRR